MENNPYSTPNADLSQGTYAGETNDKGFLGFSGRIGRIRYVAYLMAWYLIFSVVMGVVFAIFGVNAAEEPSPLFMFLIGLAYILFFVFAFVYAVRRLNDCDHSGWLSLIMLVPLVNIFFGFYLMFARGTDGMNSYGAPAKPNTLGLKILAFALPIVAGIGILAAIAIPAYQDYVKRSQAAQFQQIAE